MFFIKIILFPISIIYAAVTWVRNCFYAIGVYSIYTIPKPSICIGNLTVGGTGKTPMTEYLVKMLVEKYSIAILSRGYGRKTKGIIQADSNSNATSIGDEPFQIFKKFGHQLQVFVGEKRKLVVDYILNKFPDINLILLDDAYQHRAVSATINLLLCDYHRPFYSDWVLPTGLLRESRWGAKRAQAIVVTKCPPLLSEKDRIKIRKRIRTYAKPWSPVFFSYLNYGTPVGVNTLLPFDSSQKVFVFSGIANDRPLIQYLKNNVNLCGNITFRDHHQYTAGDIRSIVHEFEKIESINKVLITTEKDHVKLQEEGLKKLFANHLLYYLPVTFAIIQQQKEFEQFVTDSLHS